MSSSLMVRSGVIRAIATMHLHHGPRRMAGGGAVKPRVVVAAVAVVADGVVAIKAVAKETRHGMVSVPSQNHLYEFHEDGTRSSSFFAVPNWIVTVVICISR